MEERADFTRESLAGALPDYAWRLPEDAPARRLLARFYECVARCTNRQTPESRRHPVQAVATYLRATGLFARPDIEERLREMGPEDVLRVFRARWPATRARSTAAAVALFFREVVRAPRASGLRSDAFFAGATWRRRQARRRRLDAAEVRALLAAARAPLERMLLLATLTTGMRVQGFCCALARGTAAGEVWCTTEKGDRPARYLVCPALGALVRAWVAEGHAGPRYLFPHARFPALCLSREAARAVFRTVARRAGLADRPHVRPHAARHTFIWTLHALGNDIEEVARLAGHHSPDITRRWYIENECEAPPLLAPARCPWLGPAAAAVAARTTDARAQEAADIARAIAEHSGVAPPEEPELRGAALAESCARRARELLASLPLFLAPSPSPSLSPPPPRSPLHARQREIWDSRTRRASSRT